MAIGSLLIFLALLVLVALIVARPLYLTEEDAFLDSESSQWLAERERVLDALAELDADWTMGKVPKDIYAEQRGLLLAKGAIALEELEKAGKPASGQVAQKKVKKKTGDDLDALIAAYKAKRARRK